MPFKAFTLFYLVFLLIAAQPAFPKLFEQGPGPLLNMTEQQGAFAWFFVPREPVQTSELIVSKPGNADYEKVVSSLNKLHTQPQGMANEFFLLTFFRLDNDEEGGKKAAALADLIDKYKNAFPPFKPFPLSEEISYILRERSRLEKRMEQSALSYNLKLLNVYENSYALMEKALERHSAVIRVIENGLYEEQANALIFSGDREVFNRSRSFFMQLKLAASSGDNPLLDQKAFEKYQQLFNRALDPGLIRDYDAFEGLKLFLEYEYPDALNKTERLEAALAERLELLKMLKNTHSQLLEENKKLVKAGKEDMLWKIDAIIPENMIYKSDVIGTIGKRFSTIAATDYGLTLKENHTKGWISANTDNFVEANARLEAANSDLRALLLVGAKIKEQMESEVEALIEKKAVDNRGDWFALSALDSIKMRFEKAKAIKQNGQAYSELSKMKKELEDFASIVKTLKLAEGLNAKAKKLSELAKQIAKYDIEFADSLQKKLQEANGMLALKPLPENIALEAETVIEEIEVSLADYLELKNSQTLLEAEKLSVFLETGLFDDYKTMHALALSSVSEHVAVFDIPAAIQTLDQLKKQLGIVESEMQKRFEKKAIESARADIVRTGINNTVTTRITILIDSPCSANGTYAFTVPYSKLGIPEEFWKTSQNASGSYSFSADGIKLEIESPARRTYSFTAIGTEKSIGFVSDTQRVVEQNELFAVSERKIMLHFREGLEHYTGAIDIGHGKYGIACSLDGLEIGCEYQEGVVLFSAPVQKGSMVLAIRYSEDLPYALYKENVNSSFYGGYSYLEYDLIVKNIMVGSVRITQDEGINVKYVQIVPLLPCSEIKAKQTDTGYTLSFKAESNEAKFRVKIAADNASLQETGLGFQANLLDYTKNSSSEADDKNFKTEISAFYNTALSPYANYSSKFLARLDKLKNKALVVENPGADELLEYRSIRLEWLDEMREALKKAGAYDAETHELFSGFYSGEYSTADMESLLKKVSEEKAAVLDYEAKAALRIEAIKKQLEELGKLIDSVFGEYSKGASSKDYTYLFFLKQADIKEFMEKANKLLKSQCNTQKCEDDLGFALTEGEIVLDSMNKSLNNAELATERNVAYALAKASESTQENFARAERSASEIRLLIQSGKIVDAFMLSEKLVKSADSYKSVAQKDDKKELIIGLAIVGIVAVMAIAAFGRKKKKPEVFKKLE